MNNFTIRYADNGCAECATFELDHNVRHPAIDAAAWETFEPDGGSSFGEFRIHLSAWGIVDPKEVIARAKVIDEAWDKHRRCVEKIAKIVGAVIAQNKQIEEEGDC
jgi:hypothetical protein